MTERPVSPLYETSITEHENGFAGSVKVPKGVVFFFVSEITHSRQSLEGVVEIDIQDEAGKRPPFIQRLDMRSNSAIKNLVTDLNNAYGGKKDSDGYNWAIILNAFISELSRAIRESQRPTYINDREFTEPKFVLSPFLQENVPNLVFAQSQTGKTWFALRLAASLATGQPFLGYASPSGKKTLYLDYEDGVEVYSSRLYKICQGMKVDFKETSKLMPYYEPMGSLKDNVESLKRILVTESIDLIIIDAGGDATGGSPSDEQKVLELFNALRELKCTKLILHHEPKYVVSEQAAFYGSMYWKARTRLGWRLELMNQEGSRAVIKATNHKRSNLPVQEPFYYEINYDAVPFDEFETGSHVPSVTLEKTEYSEGERESSDEILYLLSQHESLSLYDMVNLSGKDRETVSRALRTTLRDKIVASKKGSQLVFSLKPV